MTVWALHLSEVGECRMGEWESGASGGLESMRVGLVEDERVGEWRMGELRVGLCILLHPTLCS